ncbi:rhodanese-like domain-containing protein [Trujillonella humicola]|uniref:rhodanese-like domain-containing protein n=1 Tax=Trujillonella humicola TaxID=3383699 RepID=UPI0039069CD2
MIPEIDPTTLAVRLRAGAVLVLDVREPDEYRRGHVPGARNLPLGRLRSQVAGLRPGVPVYVVCQSGRRSAEATAFLRTAGVDATNVAGGTAAWIASGHPCDSGA